MEEEEEEELRRKVRVVGQVPTIDGHLTSYLHFRENYMKPNLPVLISAGGLMQNWRASQDWVTPTGQPNLEFISSRFGSSQVQVADCGTRDFTDQKRLDMSVAEFIAYWNLYNNAKKCSRSNQLLYLKDWHFVKDHPDYSLYTTPKFFTDDWLNFYLEHHELHPRDDFSGKDSCSSDYRFVYMGPKGTWTPLHADVFRSYSWSANVCGRKMWHLLPPSETNYIYDRYMRNTVYNIYGKIDMNEFPYFHKTGWLECIQDKGQVLFVPSGWYHQVTNLEDAISINHNWFNGYNLHWVWNLLITDYKETVASIEDIRAIADNFEELCQRNLAANSGMSFRDFFNFIRRMATFFFRFLNRSTERWEKYMQESELAASKRQSVIMGSIVEVLSNIKSIGSVAQDMESTAYFTLGAETIHEDEGCMRQPPQQGVCLNSLDSWIDFPQHSEYVEFLTEVTHRMHEPIPEFGRDLECPKVLKQQTAQCPVPVSSLGQDSQIFEDQENALQEGAYKDMLQVLKCSMKEWDETSRKVNTPQQLALFIRSAVSILTQIISSSNV